MGLVPRTTRSASTSGSTKLTRAGWGGQRSPVALYVGLKAYEALRPSTRKPLRGLRPIPLAFGRQVRRADPKALRELVGSGTKFLPFPQSVMEASFNAANELCRDGSQRTPKFKKVTIRGAVPHRGGSGGFRVVENTFATSWRASRRNNSSGLSRPAGGKAPLRRSFLLSDPLLMPISRGSLISAERNQCLAHKKRPGGHMANVAKFLRSDRHGRWAGVAVARRCATQSLKRCPK